MNKYKVGFVFRNKSLRSMPMYKVSQKWEVRGIVDDLFICRRWIYRKRYYEYKAFAYYEIDWILERNVELLEQVK